MKTNIITIKELTKITCNEILEVFEESIEKSLNKINKEEKIYSELRKNIILNLISSLEEKVK